MKAPRKFFYIVFFIFVAAAGVLFFYSRESNADWQGPLEFKKELNIFGNVLSLVQRSYVDNVSIKRLVNGAMAGMLKTLDPYSQFLDESAYGELKSDTQGEFGGIGLEVSVKGGVLHVISPLDGSPAEKAGIKPGDVIVKIDGVIVKDMSLTDAVHKMRGNPGSTVVLSILHEGSKEIVDVPILRENLKVKGVRESKILENNIGYIRISEFQEQTAKDFKAALEDLKKQNMQALIIDVRNNPGGLLTAAVEVSENFIPNGKEVVVTKGRLLKKNVQYISHNQNPEQIQPLYLLVNKGSASGSEILAGALQDYGTAVILGTKTYGKGCIQTLTPLPDGTAVRITTSRYYTPKGRLIHEIGITPDIILTTDPKDSEDKQLQKAVDMIKAEMSHA